MESAWDYNSIRLWVPGTMRYLVRSSPTSRYFRPHSFGTPQRFVRVE